MPPRDSPAPPGADLDDRATTVIQGESDSCGLPPDRGGAASLSVPASDRRVSGSQPFRPTLRPPIPILTVFDDGRTDGETIRIRAPKFVIGRTEGDLTIPLDGRMSARHVEIALQSIDGTPRWVLNDLQSRHGLFIRVTRTALFGRAEFLVGGGRYRFEGPADPDVTIAELDDPNGLDGRDGSPLNPPAPSPSASLTELLPNGDGARRVLDDDEYWIGTDPSCVVQRADDPFCEARHVRIWRSTSDLWNIEHDHPFNGLWIRARRFVLEAPVRFQAGEQRFQINV